MKTSEQLKEEALEIGREADRNMRIMIECERNMAIERNKIARKEFWQRIKTFLFGN